MDAVGLIGTLDTKGDEITYLRDGLQALGHEVVVIDCSTRGTSEIPAGVPAVEVAAAAGWRIEDLRRLETRGEGIDAMSRGAAAVASRLYQEGKLAALLALGGSSGTTVGTAAMRALPFGVPKVMVSTMASGDTRAYVGTSDICMIHSVVDVAGLNSLTRRVLDNSLAAVAGMLRFGARARAELKPVIAVSMFGVTTACVEQARPILEEAGYEVLVFHASGAGGRAMEELIEAGMVAGVLDVTTTELADELVGGTLSAGPHRLEAAGRRGIPQVVCPGALDVVNFGPLESVPAQFADRRLYAAAPSVTVMRTTPEENARLGHLIAEKVGRAEGPAAVLLPLRGFSANDRPEGIFFDPEADRAFCEALKACLPSRIPLTEVDAHLNDPSFARAAAETLLGLLDECAGMRKARQAATDAVRPG